MYQSQTTATMVSGLLASFKRLNELITKINRTNVAANIEGKALMEWIAERDKNVAIAEALHVLFNCDFLLLQK